RPAQTCDSYSAKTAARSSGVAVSKPNANMPAGNDAGSWVLRCWVIICWLTLKAMAASSIVGVNTSLLLIQPTASLAFSAGVKFMCARECAFRTRMGQACAVEALRGRECGIVGTFLSATLML